MADHYVVVRTQREETNKNKTNEKETDVKRYCALAKRAHYHLNLHIQFSSLLPSKLNLPTLSLHNLCRNNHVREGDIECYEKVTPGPFFSLSLSLLFLFCCSFL